MSTENALGSLAAELRMSVEELQPFAALDTDHQERLLMAIQEAKRKQHDSLEVAVDGAMQHIPRLLRGPVLRILGRRK